MTSSATLLSLAEYQGLPGSGTQHELGEGKLIEMLPPHRQHGL